MPYTRKYVEMRDSIEMLRNERRSFSCPNKLWKALLEQNEGVMPVSIFIKQAILEKLIKTEPEKEECFKELID